MADKVVELIRFTQISEAEMLANILKSEGVECYVRDIHMNQIYKGVDLGGVRVELLEEDVARAREIMKAFGYLPSDNNPEIQISDESETVETLEDGIAENNPKTAKQARTMMIISFLLIILIGILVLLNNYFEGYS